MPVELKWDPALPVLYAVYSGVLRCDDYRAMCIQRQAMLDDGPAQIILVADAQQLEAFAGIESLTLQPNILLHPQVRQTLMILPEGLYNALERTFKFTEQAGYPVWFFKDSVIAQQEAEKAACMLS